MYLLFQAAETDDNQQSDEVGAKEPEDIPAHVRCLVNYVLHNDIIMNSIEHVMKFWFCL